MGMMMKAGMPVGIALIASIIVGVACGAASGVLVTIGKPPLYCHTLGIMNIARAIARTISKGGNMSAFPESFTWIGVGHNFRNGNSRAGIVYADSISAWLLSAEVSPDRTFCLCDRRE